MVKVTPSPVANISSPRSPENLNGFLGNVTLSPITASSEPEVDGFPATVALPFFVSNVIEVEFHVSAEPVIPIDPEIEVAETHGVIARAVAAASKANKNLSSFLLGMPLRAFALPVPNAQGLPKVKTRLQLVVR